MRKHHLALNRGPRENLARPAIDPLFRTAAASWGSRVIGVVLSGLLDDGTSGLRAIKQVGGVTVVQNPAEAKYPNMPQSALDFAEVDHVVPADGLAPLLVRLVAAPPAYPIPIPSDIVLENAISAEEKATMQAEDQLGERSTLSCPDCGGVLWQIHDGGLTRYRCHTGHAYTAEAMAQALGGNVEKALWSAVRLHRERVELTRQIVSQALKKGNHRLAETWQRRAENYDRDGDVLLSLLLRGEEKSTPEA